MIAEAVHYTYDQFLELTPVQADLILLAHADAEEREYEFFQSEFRNLNFYKVLTSWNSKKHKAPKKASDLYQLSTDIIEPKGEVHRIDTSKGDLDFIFKQTGLRVQPTNLN